MPGSFLTDAERERLRRFPAEVPPEDLIAYFALTDRDRGPVQKQRRDHNRLGVAMQLCVLRHLGFVPARLRAAPSVTVELSPASLMSILDAWAGTGSGPSPGPPTSKTSWITSASAKPGSPT